MSTLRPPRLTPEEYLEIERKAEFKSEYFNGEMFAMSGGSRFHDWIASFHRARKATTAGARRRCAVDSVSP